MDIKQRTYRYFQALVASAHVVQHGPCTMQEDFDGRVFQSRPIALTGLNRDLWQEHLNRLPDQKRALILAHAQEFANRYPGMDPRDAVVHVDQSVEILMA